MNIAISTRLTPPEISQISNAPGLDGYAYSSSDIWLNSENRVFMLPILALLAK
jgi:hypothetical protein